MGVLFTIDWNRVFIPSVPIAEIIVRGSLVYLVLFVLLRFVMRREAGTVGLADVLLIVLIADASQNAMAAEYRSVTDGIILVATLVFWNFVLDWLSDHSPRVRRFLNPPPLLLIKNGKLLRKNMRRELVTEDELMAELRKQGLESPAEVRAARMEGDGQISVIPVDRHGDAKPGGGRDRGPAGSPH